MKETTFHQEGEYLIPDLTSSNQTQIEGEIGKYALLREKHLKENQRKTYYDYLTTGTLKQHLVDIQNQSMEMLETLISQMARTQGLTEDLKMTDQTRWVGLMNNIKLSAEEMVLNQLIYC